MWKTIVIVFLFLLQISGVNAQPISLTFDHLTVDDGLSSNRIGYIYRDSKDYLWMATDAGLDRFDSQNIVQFRYSESSAGSISSNHITSIFEDRHHNLWFGSDQGLNLYDPKTETFKVYKHDPSDDQSLDSDHVVSMIEDNDGNLWIMTGTNCLNQWIPDQQAFKHFKYIHHDISIYAPYVDMIDMDSKGNFWFPLTGSGIFRFDTKKKEFTKFDDPDIDFGNDCYKSIYIDDNDKCWIATEGSGFFSFDPSDGKFYKYPINESGTGVNRSYVLDIAPEGDRYLLLAVDQGGVNIFDKVNNTFSYVFYGDTTYNTGLNNNGIWCFYRDREGILWVGTSGGGVNYYNPKKKRFELFRTDPLNANSLSYNFTDCFYEDTNGEIWIGTDGGGISVYNPKTGNFRTYRHNPDDPHSVSGNVIRGIEGNKDNIWIGTWDAGLNRFDKKTKKFYHYMPDAGDPTSISGRTVWGLKMVSDTTLWLGIRNTSVDLFHVTKGVTKRIRPDSGERLSLISAEAPYFWEDENQNIWIATQRGLHFYDIHKDSVIYYNHFPDNFIAAFCEDTNGNLWAGSSVGGLFLFDRNGQVLKRYSEQEGLANDNIQAIVEDNSGRLWISTYNGLSRFDPKTEKFRNYTKEDGLQGNQFFIQSFFKAKDGKIYFGGYNGFNAFYPDSLIDNDFIPPVIFTDFKLFNKSVEIGGANSPLKYHIDESEKIILSWKQSVFSFEFVGINYTNPENNSYKYMLEGFDDDWVSTDATRNYCTYTNLDPGEYTLWVKASNNDGIWNEQGKSIRIVIIPPFWQTVWFRLLIVAFILGFVYLFFFLRTRQLRNNNVILEKKVQERTVKLNSLINELKEKQNEIEATNEELQSAQEELQQVNEQLDIRVQERTQKLVKANQELDRFVYSASHDLSAPLKSILGLINITRIENRNSELLNHLGYMENSVLKLEKVIKSLTQFSRNTGFEVKKDINYFDQIVEEVLNEMNFSYDHGKVNIVKNYSKKEKICTDTLRLKIVLQNLISNAIKYRKMDAEQSNVVIGFSTGKDQYQIQIKDDGIGIDPLLLEKVFTMFYRGTEQSDGSGLGLYIVKETLSKLNGEIQVESELGSYTCIDVSIPKQSDGQDRKVD